LQLFRINRYNWNIGKGGLVQKWKRTTWQISLLHKIIQLGASFSRAPNS
jgi:hypothetical protein